MTNGRLHASRSIPSVVLLNGTSSTGKTSIAKELQELLPEPFLRFGLDHLFDMVPKPWSGGRAGPLSADGFAYRDLVDSAGRPATRIAYGSTGRRMLWAFHNAVSAFVASGNRIIVDTIVLDEAEAAHWKRALDELDVLVVGLQADVEVLEERERDRGQRSGLARGHRNASSLLPADVALDTGSLPPRELARRIAAHFSS